MASLVRAMNGSPPPPGPMSRILSEEDAFRQMSPIDQLRAPSPQVGPEQAAANQQQNLRDLLSIVPGPGNVIAAEDATQSFGNAADYAQQGRYGRAAVHGGLGALSAFGAVTGLPTGRMAGNAAKGASSTLFSGAGPTPRAVKLERVAADDLPPGADVFHMQKDGSSAGFINGGLDPKDPSKFVIYSIAMPQGPNSLGAAAMRDVYRQIQEHHPQVTHITGTRLTGARARAGVDVENSKMSIPIGGR